MATTLRASTVVDVEQERAWALLCDFSRWSEWVAFTDEVVEHPDELHEGAVYRERSHVGPVKQVSEWRVTEFDAPHRQVHIGRVGPMRPTLTMVMEPEGQGTRFPQTIEFSLSLGPLAGLVERLPASQMRKGLVATNDGFKTFAERDAAGAPAPAANQPENAG